MHILFVGDEAILPPDLGDYLADLGEGTHLEKAASGRAAMAALSRTPFDVVIAGPASPNHSPADLLDQTRTLRPEAIRIALIDANSSVKAPAARLVGVAHRFLSLPLASEHLIEAIHSIDELREILDDPRLRALVGRIDNLPSPPQLYFTLMHALEDEERSSSADIAKLIAGDPAIAAKVLRMCNSAYFSNGRSISDLRSAVTRLGMATLRDLVLASEVFSMSSSLKIDRTELQRRSLLASRLPSRMLPETSAELGATAALLADIGLLLPGVRNERHPPEDGVEDDRPGHTEAGAYLLGLWGLPMPIVEAVAFHRQPQRSGQRSFWVPGAVHVAVALAAREPVDEQYLATLGVLPRLPAWRELAESLAALDTPAGRR
ncbi:HDOD domain-containing protein [Dokdonella sp. MW10]|uniref:HDOD domain-containing protein n=1 Tax=Dokdonella sp. MW10 TaxID=2992926 RepID=UPI003F7F5321